MTTPSQAKKNDKYIQDFETVRKQLSRRTDEIEKGGHKVLAFFVAYQDANDMIHGVTSFSDESRPKELAAVMHKNIEWADRVMLAAQIKAIREELQ